MKIVLIHPPWINAYGSYQTAAKIGAANHPPLGLCYLASSLNKKEHEVKIIDAEAEGLTLQKIIKKVACYSPDLIGITATTPIIHQAKGLAVQIKKVIDKVPIVIGGPHLSAMPTETLKECSSFDYGIYGESEETFPQLVNTLKKEESVKKIKGLLFRKGKKIIKTEQRPFKQNLDEFPFPNRSLLKLDKYMGNVPEKGIVKLTTIMTSRGCPYKCIFCSQKTVFGTTVRFRSSENVLTEIEHISNDLGIKHLIFTDDTLTLNKDRLKKICKGIIKRRLGVTWEGWTRADAVNEKILKLMKKAGFVSVSFGIESGNPQVLKILKKGVTLEQLKKAYVTAKKVGLETRGSVMIGNPNETEKTIKDTLRFIKNLKECDQIYLSIATPYPGTELYEIAKNNLYGMKLLTQDFSKYTRYGSTVIEVNDLKREDLIRYQKKGFLLFYLTSKRIYYNLKRAGLKAGIKNTIAFAESVFKKKRLK